ncbi:T-complex protein 11-like protein 1 like [Verticillium longisporum]|nr:T-complex protein 11-like protein 1 like [Verticillium longisporum]
MFWCNCSSVDARKYELKLFPKPLLNTTERTKRSKKGTHTTAMLLATIIGKITSFYQKATHSYFDGGVEDGIAGQGNMHGLSSTGASLGISLGAYTLGGEDGRWLELEILARELHKLEEVYAQFRDVCGELTEDPEVSRAMIGYLGHNLGTTLKVTVTPPATPLKASTKPQPPLPIVLAPGLSGLLPQNRVVVHELAINREYRIPADEYCEHRATFQQPLFEGMRAELHSNESEAGFMYFATMMRYFKESLQRLVRPGAFMHKTIGEVLDVELAEQQFQMGSFSYEKFFTAVSSLLPKLCAPYRDDECKDLVTNKLHQGTLVDRVEALTGFIDVMLCDYVNYMLSTAAPQLIESGPQYEAKKFDEALEKGHHKLTAAVEAWRSARLKVLAEASKRDPEGINHAKNRPTADKFYAQMMVDLFTQALPIREETVPEMLLLDYKRMQRLSLASQRIVTAAAILLQCKNILKRDVRSPWKAEAARIMLVLEAKHDKMETTVHGVMVALEAGRTMPAATKTHLRALVTKVVQASQDSILNGAEPQEPVLRLLLTRLRGHMFARLGAGSASEKVKAASTAGERLAGLGLAEFATQVREIVDELARVGAVDRAAHTKWWEAVSEKVQQEEAATSTTVA